MSFNVLNNKKLISIEAYITNPEQNQRINSPYSIKAINSLGYSQSDIEYLPITKFQELDDRFCTLSKEIKQRRYETFNKCRLLKIQEIYECRNQLKEKNLLNEGNNKSYENILNYSCRNFNDSNDFNSLSSSAIKEEIKQFERNKRKNEQDLINSVEFELKRQIMLKEKEAKIRRQDFKMEMLKKKNEAKHVIETQQKEIRERKKREKELQIKEENIQRNKEKYLKQQKRMKKVADEEEEKLIENKRKQLEQECKRQLFYDKVNQMNELKHQHLINKMNELNEQEVKRQQNLEEKRLKQMEINNEKSRKKQEQIQKNKENYENILNSIKTQFQLKQQKSAAKKKRLDEERDLEIKQRAEEANKRAAKTKEVLIKDKENQQRIIDNYNRKQELIAIKKKEIETQNQKEQDIRKQKNIEREEHMKMILDNNEQLLLHKKQATLDNLHLKKANTIKLLSNKSMENLQRIEEIKEKLILKQNYIREVQKKKEDKIKENSLYITEKRNKIEKIKEQQRALSERKKIIKDEILLKRQMYEMEFKNLFHNKQLDDQQIIKIHQMFPDNEKINCLLIKLAELEREKENERESMRLKTIELDEELRRTKEKFSRNISMDKKKNQSELIKTNQQIITEKETSPNKTYNDITVKKNLANDLYMNEENIKTIDNTQNAKSNTKHKKLNKNNSISIYKIEDEIGNFPNKDFHKHIFTLKIKEPTRKSISIGASEKEIKLQQYNMSLMKAFIELIQTEKIKEEYRIELYNKAKNEEKRKLGKQIIEAREQSIALIMKKKEENNAKLKKFEQSL